jgi:hypothetical protein
VAAAKFKDTAGVNVINDASRAAQSHMEKLYHLARKIRRIVEAFFRNSFFTHARGYPEAPDYGTCTVSSPGSIKVITPPQMHMSWETLSSVGMLPSITVGAPGTQGAGVIGTQGMGVNTPMAAAVAEATSGLAGDMHIAKGMILTIGTWSMMLASGTSPVNTSFTGRTTNELGAIPNVHCIIAPMQT